MTEKPQDVEDVQSSSIHNIHYTIEVVTLRERSNSLGQIAGQAGVNSR